MAERENIQIFEVNLEAVQQPDAYDAELNVELPQNIEANMQLEIPEINVIVPIITSISENSVELPVDENGNVDITVPTKVSELDNDEDFVSESELSSVAFSGDYNDLVNLPEIPSLSGYATETFVGSAITTHNTSNDSHTDIRNLISGINEKIPSQASDTNQLADKNFVNSSISTATATFKGTYNLVSDLSLTTAATHSDIATALGNTITGADSNDYCYVQIPTSGLTPTEIASTERYKFVTGTGWQYEYDLNNSGFTAVQWSSINSGATSTLINQITTNANDISSLQTSVSGKVSQSGDTMTGNLNMSESIKVNFQSNGYETYFLQKSGGNLSIGRTNGNSADVILLRAFTTGISVRSLYITTGSATADNQVLKRSDGDLRWSQIAPPISTTATLVSGSFNELGTIDYSTIALPSTPGTAEYNGTFTSSNAGDIRNNTGLSSVTKWQGDVTIETNATYSFCFQNGFGIIVKML